MKNLLPLYQFSLLNNSYTFHTDHGLDYFCGFRNVLYDLSPVLGMYDIEVNDFEFFPYDPEPEVKKPIDARVGPTIVSILDQYFIKENRVLVYLCDTFDEREAKRQKLFERWHENAGTDIKLNPVKATMSTGRILYGGILTRPDFQHMDVLRQELLDPYRGVMAQKGL